MLVFVSDAMLIKKALIPFFERLCDWFQPQIESTAWALGVSRPWVVGIDFFTCHWQSATVSGCLFLL